MSRTIKGSKPIDYEYWSKCFCNKCFVRGLGRSTKKQTLSRERLKQKMELRGQVSTSPL